MKTSGAQLTNPTVSPRRAAGEVADVGHLFGEEQGPASADLIANRNGRQFTFTTLGWLTSVLPDGWGVVGWCQVVETR